MAVNLDWATHRLHRRQVADDLGMWVGLLDENGVPMLEAPPVVSLSAPEVRGVPGELMAEFSVQSPRGHVHPMVDDLIADGLGRVDAQGQLDVVSDATRFISIELPAEVRRTYRVTHCVASGLGDAPSRLVVHGVDMLKLLDLVPAISAPLSWVGEWTTFTRDWAGPENTGITFDKPRDLAGMQMVTVADGATVEGPAEDTIRRVVTESLAAAFRVAGVATDPPIVVDPAGSGVPSPHVLIRPTDGPLLSEIMPVALAAGVVISARMWWPGDDPVPGLVMASPTVVVEIRQTVEVSS